MSSPTRSFPSSPPCPRTVDDCWMEKRGANGVIMPFKDKFPNGLKPLADYIHSKGLKFGVYSGGSSATVDGRFSYCIGLTGSCAMN